MIIKECLPYRSETVKRRLLKCPDGKSAFKIYYLSIVGRQDRAKYEWPAGVAYEKDFEARMTGQAFEGIGFVTAFPHITKVFRFAPAAETVLHVRAYRTPDLSALDLGREDGFMEFACYAEAAIAADEYKAWAGAATVEDYLKSFSDFVDGPIATNRKLGDYWNG